VTPDRWLVVVGIALWVGSLFLPAIEGSGFPTLSGLDVLWQGASGWRNGVLAWYANPVLGAAILACWIGRYRFALAAGTLGLALGLSSFTAGAIAENAGRSVPPFGFAIGFYVWLAAFLAALAGALAGIYKVSRRPQ
jgi:hypothetical protein